MKKIFRRLYKMVVLGIMQMKDPYYQGFAAQVAFYLLLSIVPIILLIIQILGIFNISTDMAMTLIEEYTGKRISSMVSSLFTFESVGFGNIIFAVIALWAGSRASFSIMRITNYTLTDGTSTGQNYLLDRLRAIRTMFFTIITVVFAIVILVYGELILNVILDLLSIEYDSSSMWMNLRWLIGFGLYFLMVAYNYWIMPTVRVTFKSIVPGSIFASVGMLVVTMFYSTYASSLANYDVLYGALSSVIAIMIWFFLISWVLFLGVLCNKVWSDSEDYNSAEQMPINVRKVTKIKKH